ncbi:MAG: hypothetical protein AAGN46_07000 [Acidobacteriota bacterium]
MPDTTPASDIDGLALSAGELRLHLTPDLTVVVRGLAEEELADLRRGLRLAPQTVARQSVSSRRPSPELTSRPEPELVIIEPEPLPDALRAAPEVAVRGAAARASEHGLAVEVAGIVGWRTTDGAGAPRRGLDLGPQPRRQLGQQPTTPPRAAFCGSLETFATRGLWLLLDEDLRRHDLLRLPCPAWSDRRGMIAWLGGDAATPGAGWSGAEPGILLAPPAAQGQQTRLARLLPDGEPAPLLALVLPDAGSRRFQPTSPRHAVAALTRHVPWLGSARRRFDTIVHLANAVPTIATSLSDPRDIADAVVAWHATRRTR